ncbi:hypothetical protein [Peptostreptococcus sp.]|uniref:hypothetical protein n=1 Tax=Peptostreptococcus sp. TaxID=1262 RepID=UPI001D86A2F5|nr:hypothetical protein [Peptostreptococcus sp.]MBS5597245.1 hypothetical protein [Peptostreptococcus sp.]
MNKKISILLAATMLSVNVLNYACLSHADEINTSNAIVTDVEDVGAITPSRVGGSDSPSGAWQLKTTTVTKFTRVSQIDAAIRYNQAILDKVNRRDPYVTFAGIASELLVATPPGFAAYTLINIYNLVNTLPGFEYKTVERSLSVLKSARKRLVKNGAANVKTKVYYRPINNVHMLIFY